MPTDIFNLGEQFFVIRSDDLQSVKTRLYGWCLAANGDVITNAADLAEREAEGRKEGKDVPAEGAYVFIKRTAGTIVITQDFLGSYGLYLFREGDFWALSNSFIYLVDALKKSHRLTFNKEFADQLLALSLCSLAYAETLVNEISCLDRAVVVTANVTSGNIEISLRDYGENSVAPDSAEGMELLDAWYAKWTETIRNIKRQNGKISVDLSGGFDSREIFSLFLGSGIDLNEVCVRSNPGNVHTYAEDYEIASVIANRFRFKLNRLWNGNCETFQPALKDIINIPFYTKLGFHKSMNWPLAVPCNGFRYHFPGNGGECIRGYWSQKFAEGRDALIRSFAWRANAYSVDGAEMAKSIRTVLTRAFEGIARKFQKLGHTDRAENVFTDLYRETRCRAHFGAWNVEAFFSGTLMLTPLMDPELHRLKLCTEKCADRDLLMALILDRYNKVLLDFKYEGQRSFAPETLEYARALNDAFPPKLPAPSATYAAETAEETKMPKLSACIAFPRNVPAQQTKPITRAVAREIMKAAFFSAETKGVFESLYSPDTYIKQAECFKDVFRPDANTYSAFAVCRILNDCRISADATGASVGDTVLRLAKHEPHGAEPVDPAANPTNYITARIDIKNAGTPANDVEISGLPSGTTATTPGWYSKNGRGHVIESAAGTLNLALRCVGNGTLEIVLRGRAVRNQADERIPIVIDFSSLKLDGNDVFTGVQSVWHDFPYIVRRNVKNGQTLALIVTWTRHVPRKAEIDALTLVRLENA